MTRFTFDQYRKIFDGALAKYEGLPFFADVIKGVRRPDFPAQPREVVVFGIRHEGKEIHDREDTADDTISLVRIATTGEQQVYEYDGTTEPGDFTEVVNPLGDFKMSPGLYFFKQGLHHSKNPCLVQACNVTGMRGAKGQLFDKPGDITDGTLHIHAGILRKEHVGNWSAGCQVIALGWQGAPWTEFFKYAQMATNFPIPYVLVDEADIPQFLA
jgi:hypothetical protein